MRLKTLPWIAAAFLPAHPVAAEPWRIDEDQAHVTFMVDNLGFSTTQGQFRAFDAEIDFDPQFVEEASVVFTLVASSVDTNSEARDGHLRSREFLDVAHFPEIVFRSSKVRLTSPNTAEITGEMTIRGVTREEVFDATLVRLAPNPFDRRQTLAGFRAEGVLNRLDYGVSYGAPAIGADIRIRVDIQISPVS